VFGVVDLSSSCPPLVVLFEEEWKTEFQTGRPCLVVAWPFPLRGRFSEDAGALGVDNG